MKRRLYLRSCLVIACLVLNLQCLYGRSSQNSAEVKAGLQSLERDGQHDFDFAIGKWRTHLSRLRHPLAGSNEWVNYEGSSVVRKVWDGRANLEEFEAHGAAGSIDGLTLRLYNPQSHQWNQSWSTSNDGTLSQPMVRRIQQRPQGILRFRNHFMAG